MSAHFVGPALDSLLSQACADFELIVVDDGSTDETAAILHAYAKRDARIRFLRNETNRGLIFTRNRALQESRGRYVAIADADDLFHPQRFEKQLKFLRDHPACGVVGSGVEILNHDVRKTPELAIYTEDRDIRFFMRLLPVLWNTTTCYRRDLLLEAGGYREGFEAGAEDYDLLARLLPLTRFANLPEPLVKVRLHAASVSAEGFRCQRNVLRISARLIEEFLQHPVPIELREQLHCFLMHAGMESSACERAFTLAREFYHQAAGVEASDTLQLFGNQLAQSAWTQAQYQVYAARRLSRVMAGFALRLRPKLWVQPECAWYCCRWLAPGWLRLLYHRGFRTITSDRRRPRPISGAANLR